MSEDNIVLTKKQAKDIAKVLNSAMCPAGYFDDWDEVIGDMIDNNVTDQCILEFAQQVSTAVEFMNTQLDPIEYITNSFYDEAVEYLNESKK